MFLINLWHVGADDHEVGREPVAGMPRLIQARLVLDRIHLEQQAAAAKAVS